ncbi:MAG: ATP-binding protein [Clostridiales bacterium]|nr:ATP-binding protein [Clostridiales bacterium]
MVVNVGGEKILPVAAIYGANASGKSNVDGMNAK